MKFGSLFSGIGGFDLGFERAGMECAWQCEIDQPCQKLLSHKFGARLYDDVRTITAGNAEPVDLICGGFPCQDVSIAGKRTGLAGERSGLWSEFARIIEEFKPRWVVVENVPGLLSSNQGRDFETVISQMVESGYGVCWRILDAQYFGVAQRRRRVFIVGSLGDGRSAEILFEREGVRWNPLSRGKTRQGIAGDAEICAHETGKGFWTEGLPGLRGQPGGMPENIVMATGQAGAEVVSDGSPSLTANHEQPIVFSSGVRRLTPTECERLQGFPDGWTAGQSDSTRYKQLGNAVAVPVAEWIGRRIMGL